MEKNTISLILSRISLAITSVYVFYILYLIISTTYRMDHGEKDLGVGFGMVFAFLLPHLLALVITTILNIIISFEKRHTFVLVITTLILYAVTGFLGAVFIPYTLVTVIIQIILLLIACITYKRNTYKNTNITNSNDTNNLNSSISSDNVIDFDNKEVPQSRKFIKNNNLAKVSLIISVLWALYLIIPTLLSLDKNYYYNPYYFISLIIAILLNALVIQKNGSNQIFNIMINIVAALYLFTFLQDLIAIFVVVLALTIIVNIYMNKPLPYEAGIIITIFSSLLYFITSVLFGAIGDIPYLPIVPLVSTAVLALSLLAK
jgi:hypothetical protein